MTSVLMKTDDPHWKEFVTKPSLKYILQILSGLAQGHSRTQMLIAEHCIPILHQMEQVSSDEHVGSLAEGVLEAMKGCSEAEEKVRISISFDFILQLLVVMEFSISKVFIDLKICLGFLFEYRVN